MSIRIQKILSDQGEFCVAEFSHGEKDIQARVYKSLAWLTEKKDARENIIFEMDYDEVIGHRNIPNFNDFDSVIQQVESGYLIRGRVHQIMELEKDTIIDLYLQTGAEFISILSSDLQAKVEIGSGLEVMVKSLKFYPADN